MSLKSLKMLAQDAIGTAKDRVEKVASSVGNPSSGAPPSFDGVVKSLKAKATEVADALRETKFVRPIVDGVNTVVDTSQRVARAANAAREAFAAEPPGKPMPNADAAPAQPASPGKI